MPAISLRRHPIVLLFMLSISGCQSLSNQASSSPELAAINDTIANIVLPGHRRLQDSAEALAARTNAFCQAPDQSGHTALQNQWYETLRDWAALGPINYGAIDSLNATWQFQFWPDPLNLVERKFASRLSGQDPKIDAAGLSNGSPAIQGISALEYLLFDPALDSLDTYAPHPHRCRILAGTAQNLSAHATTLNDLWNTREVDTFTNSTLEKEHPGHFKRHLEIIYSGLVAELDRIKDKKIAAPFGLDKALSHPETAARFSDLEYWRSGASLEAIAASLSTCQNIYTRPKGLSWYLSQRLGGESTLDQSIRHDFALALSQLERAAAEIASAKTVEATPMVQALHQTLVRLHYSLRVNYAKAAGLDFRFNSHDGD